MSAARAIAVHIERRAASRISGGGISEAKAAATAASRLASRDTVRPGATATAGPSGGPTCIPAGVLGVFAELSVFLAARAM